MEPAGGARGSRCKRAGSPLLKPGGKGDKRQTSDPEMERQGGKEAQGQKGSDRDTDRKRERQRRQ